MTRSPDSLIPFGAGKPVSEKRDDQAFKLSAGRRGKSTGRNASERRFSIVNPTNWTTLFPRLWSDPLIMQAYHPSQIGAPSGELWPLERRSSLVRSPRFVDIPPHRTILNSYL